MSQMIKNDGQNGEKKDKETDEWINSILIAIVAAVIIRIFIFAPTIVLGPSMSPTLDGGNQITSSIFNFKSDRLIAERVTYFLRKSPNRGDVITFSAPNSEFYVEKNIPAKVLKFFTKKEYIKRVIGVGGDHIQIKGDTVIVDGEIYNNFDIKGDKLYLNGELLNGDHSATMENVNVYLNGIKLDEPYIKEAWYSNFSVVNGRIGLQKDTYGLYIGNGNEDINLDLTVPKGYVFAMGDNRNDSNDCRKFSPSRNDYLVVNGCISLKELSGRVLFRFWPFERFGKV